MTATEANSPRAGICVMGRSDLTTDLGRATLAALDIFSRYFDVSYYPVRDTTPHPGAEIALPSGRVVTVADSLAGFAVYFYADAVREGFADLSFQNIPTDGGFRVAHVSFDSTELPQERVAILNDRFDLVLVTSSHLEAVAVASGVRTPIVTLPIGLDIEELIARRYTPPMPPVTRFGTVATFHERKQLDVLIEAFRATYPGRDDVELVIHAADVGGGSHQRLAALIARANDPRITLSYGVLLPHENSDLLDSFDVFVSASSGEGYAVAPREALALGKPVVLSNIPDHAGLARAVGVFLVDGAGFIPARYPEIDNRVIGSGVAIEASDLGVAMEKARAYVLAAPRTDAHERKMLAAEYSIVALAPSYARVVDADFPSELRSGASRPLIQLPPETDDLIRATVGRNARKLGARPLVVPVRDAGFFSIFNVFMQHLTWSLQDDRVSMVLPDWDAGRLIERSTEPIVSYCYSQPNQGNMWLQLFQPLYGLSADDLNDTEFLYADSLDPNDPRAARREPLLTYVNAFHLYRAPWFGRFRKQYNGAMKEFVHLRPELQAEIDGMLDTGFGGRFTIAVHVKHPSHAVEQPGMVIAGLEQYLGAVRRELATRGIAESSDDWRVFVATDQERVVRAFIEQFGDHVVRFDDVSRVSLEEQERYDLLETEDQLRDGHQLQHLMSADVSRWSSRLAWEVWRDAESMASSDVLIHGVSNVATAASYMGPDVSMVYLDPFATD
ncbi:glycosyltransferase [Glaciihabitans sp. dw_435]|uniref:glycosyltransferase n=1 Tax=Glaciihabitans sp. dw_435 TaxID=2720081 RepID=UPI001BD5038C|nr:glycosyltransferase [Glaciihabitans sp. dw_435]